MGKGLFRRVGLRRIALLALGVLTFLLATGSAAQAYVYYSNGFAIYRANLDGTGVKPLITNCPCGQFYPRGIAVSWNRIYWAEDHVISGGTQVSSIGRAYLDGTGANHSFIKLAAVDNTYGVAVNNGHVYWAPDYHGTPNPSIGRALLNGKQVLHSWISGVGCPQDVDVDSDFIYWTNTCDVGNIVGGTIGRAG